MGVNQAGRGAELQILFSRLQTIGKSAISNLLSLSFFSVFFACARFWRLLGVRKGEIGVGHSGTMSTNEFPNPKTPISRSLELGSAGPQVTALQQRLQQRGFDPGAISGQFTAATDAAVRAFQRSVGLPVDGQAGPNTMAALVMPTVKFNVTVDMVLPMFPVTPRVNIQFHLPIVLKALLDAEIADKEMVLMALGTIRAETEGFQPIDEFESEYNTSPGGHPFDLYDHREGLGNLGPPDGERFKGRGFVQLTGRAYYQQIGKAIGLGDQLVQEPELANDPGIAAQILAAVLREKEDPIRQALQAADFTSARRLVNGGTHGLTEFQEAFQRGQVFIPENVEIQLG